MGLDANARGWELVLRLLRPAAILSCIQLYRIGFALGTLQALPLSCSTFPAH